MTPERWRRVTEIVHAALARTPAARAAFLDETCQDGSLRADVDALLAGQAPDAGSERVDVRAAGPHFEPGVALGPYRIEALVGAGGMGEVYRATDRRLQRTVAIKVLLPGLSSGSGFDLRFEREAQLLASLNHPNIGAIYGLEDLDGIRALVLEFVEGPTLAQRIDAGRLPVHEALGIARQVTFALQAAHEKDIVHRDLKPSNIKITPDGVVKILDFGIAKSGDRGAPEAVTAAPTRTGLILGTAGYMSPEQARGRRVDKRTDIWAFGCVLFEMLTGRSPFHADTTSDVIARILERDPPWPQLPADVPPAIHKVLRRCLEKDANERLHDIADARIEIAEALTHTKRRGPGERWSAVPAGWLWAGLALAAVASIAFFAYRWGGTPSGSTVELGVTFPENVVPAHGVAVSPDGRRVAVGTTGRLRQIWMHSLETAETRAVPGTERSAFPFWSPDGSRLAFFQAGVLRALNLSDGTLSEICKASSAVGGTWTADGRIIIAQDGQLFAVRPTGGEPKLLTRMKVPESLSYPQLLPDGRHVLFYSQDLSGGWAAAANLETGKVQRIVASDGPAVFTAPDRLLHVRGASIVVQTFNPATLALGGGEPQVIANGAGPGALTEPQGTISVSPTGVLAFLTARAGRAGQLTWFDRSGRAGSAIKQPDEGEYLNPAISPDGARVAVNAMDRQTGNWDVWIVDAARGVPTKLTSDDAIDSDAVWSPDGKEVVFSSTRGGHLGLYRQAIDGAGSAEPIYVSKSAQILTATDWTPDGKFIVFAETSPASIWLLPLASDRKPTSLLNGWNPRVSPDGQWIAYGSPEAGTGMMEIYVQRFPGLGSKQRISQGGGYHARWINEGRELVYWAIPGGLNVVNVIRGAPVGETRSIIQVPIPALIDSRTHYDAARDGRRFLARQTAGPPGPGVKVILNWTGRLKK